MRTTVRPVTAIVLTFEAFLRWGLARPQTTIFDQRFYVTSAPAR